MKRLLSKQLSKLRQKLSSNRLALTWGTLGICLGLGYYPAISLPLSRGNVQLSLALVATISLLIWAAYKRSIDRQYPGLIIGLGLLVTIIISSVDLGSDARLLLLLIGLIIGLVLVLRVGVVQIKYVLLGLIGVALLSVVVAVYQVVADSAGITSGLPSAYTGELFGFARARAFMEEPQFLGSLLVAALGATVVLNLGKFRNYLVFTLAFGLVLTTSRGAIYSLLFLLALYPVYLLVAKYKHWRIVRLDAKMTAFMFIGLFTGGLMLIGAGYYRQNRQYPPSDYTSVLVNHLLGKTAALDYETTELSLPSAQGVNSVDSANPTVSKSTAGSTDLGSTNVGQDECLQNSGASRKCSWDDAFTLFNESSTINKLVGYGPYGFDEQLGNDAVTRRAVINNRYLETVIEYGIIGFGLMIAIIVFVLYKLLYMGAAFKNKKIGLNQKVATALFIILFTGSFQLLFHSSIVNHLHFWVILAVSFGLSANRGEQTS